MPRAVTLVVVALLGCQPVANAPSSPTSTPTATATTSPTASVLDGRFGLVVVADSRGNTSVASVRSETSDAVITTFMPQERSWTSLSRTVSPDGRSIAYWASVNSGPVLHVREVSGGSDRTVFTGASEMFGNTFAWSSDGTGLVVAIDNGCQEFCRSVAELWTVDLATGANERIASGRFWLPAVWDRGAKLIVAGVTGPGGYLVAHDVIDLHQQPYAIRSTEVSPAVIGRLAASNDARFMLLSVDSNPTPSLSWWPLAEPQKRQDVAFDGATAEWRPGTSEIWWVGGRTPAGCRVSPCAGTELKSFEVMTGRTATSRGSYGATLVGFRVDGSAAMTLDRSGGPESLIVVDIRTGQTARLPAGGPFVRLR